VVLSLSNFFQEAIMAKIIQPLSLLACLLILLACAPQTKTGKGATYGAAGGAVAGGIIGQIIGGDTESTLIGTAIGAAVGGAGGAAVGNMMDRQEAEMRQALAESEAAAVRREGNLLEISLRGDVTFDTDSAVIKPGLYSEIDRIANILNKYPRTVIQVEGHTDSTGSESYNMELSARRAEAVKNVLVRKGVDPSRILTLAFGESEPIASNDTAYGRARNRRVEIKVAPTT
jgi:outer membrane protein OmpA-like peptidoglycan-associated protein